MDDALLISRTFGEVRVALLRGGALAAFQVERATERGVVGNIYRGRVLRVLPGMQAAFVDVGLERAAFLYVGDAVPPAERAALLAEHAGADVAGDGSAEEPAPAELADDAPTPESDDPGPDGDLPVRERIRRKVRIQDVLQPGDAIVAQVAKDPMRGKGARITRQLTIPGRFLVYIPGSGHVGVSRRITDGAERARLRAVVEGCARPGEGFIARTACEGRTEDELVADVAYLRAVVAAVDAPEADKVPAMLHAELDLVLRAVRDLVQEGVERVIVDDGGDAARVRDFVARFLPRFVDRVELWSGPAPLLEEAGVEKGIARALSRKVHLPSGAYLVIDHTEALTAIDVNSGRFVGQTDLEDTIVQVNLEAARAIPEQLRVRDIGGLIVVDFIDMQAQSDRQRVYDELMQALSADRARCSVLPVSDFGLVQMTRHRVRDDLARQLLVPCAQCQGEGRVRAAETVAYDALRAIRKARGGGRPGQVLSVRCSAAALAFLDAEEPAAIAALSAEIGAPVRLQSDGDRGGERVTVQWIGGGAP